MSEEIMDSVLQNLRSLAGPPRGGTQRAPCYMNLEFHRCLFPQGERARRRLKCEAGVHTHKFTRINMHPPLIFNDQSEKEESLEKEHDENQEQVPQALQLFSAFFLLLHPPHCTHFPDHLLLSQKLVRQRKRL